MRAPILAVLALIALPVTTVHALETTTPSPPPEPPSDPEPWIADFEGIEIDLRDGWDGAKACLTDGITTECFDTEAEMLAAAGVSATAPPSPAGSGFRRSSCSSFLRLYSGSYYNGSVLGLNTRFSVMNLSSYGFNNITSSYRVGDCGSAMWDASNGTSGLYPGNTSAGVSAGVMQSGWDNRISSVYIG